MLKFFLSIVLCFVAFLSSAQLQQDVVYLKNGSILKGTLLQNDSIVKIEIIGGSIFSYDANEVLKTAKEEYKRVNFKGPITLQQDGWFTEISFGIPYGIDQWGWPTGGVTLNGILGYQFKSLVKVGLGTGIDYYGNEATMLPFFTRATGDLTQKTTTPFYVVDLGYAANISSSWNNDEDHYGGFLMFLGGGFKFNTRRNYHFNFSLGYKTQFASSYYFQTWLEEPFWEYRQFNRVEGRIAIGF
ncbi:MAG: hypothetical protein JXQ87_15795 [Bacteroidia bacterium]